MFTNEFNTLNKNDSVKQLVLDEQALFIWVHKQDARIWELVKVIWILSYGFICAAYKSKSFLQMACQEKDTESLKSLQTELWWAFKNFTFPSCDLDRASFLSLLNLKFPYCLCVSFSSSGHFWLLSRIIFSTWWFRSASHRLDKASSAVQFLLTSSGNHTLFNGTFLFLTGSVVRPEEVLFSKPWCCNLYAIENFASVKQSHTDLEISRNPWVWSEDLWGC